MEANKIQLHHGTKVPKEAVVLSEAEVLKMQSQAMNDKTLSEIWALRYGTPILGVTASLGGWFFNNYYRRRLKLGRTARLATYLPLVGLPFLIASASHSSLVTSDLLVLKTPCSVCLELRATAVQLSIGFIYPLILGSTATFSFANSYATYPLPPLFSNPKEVYNIWKKMTLRITTQITFLVLAQAIAATVITHIEWKESVNLLKSSFNLNILK